MLDFFLLGNIVHSYEICSCKFIKLNIFLDNKH